MSSDVTARALAEPAMWEALAGAWDARGGWHADATRPVTDKMLECAAPTASGTVVELACGPTADCALAAATTSPAPSRVIASDLTPAMVAAAGRRATAAGADIECRLLDATALDLDTASVDVLFARWLYMLLPDPATGFVEAARVLRPGGRLVFTVFAAATANPFFMLPASVLIERGLLQPPAPGRPSMFALSDEDRLRALVVTAGLVDVTIEQVDLVYQLADLSDLRSFLAEFIGPIALVLSSLDDGDAADIHAEIERRAAAFRDRAVCYALPASALVCTVRKPISAPATPS